MIYILAPEEGLKLTRKEWAHSKKQSPKFVYKIFKFILILPLIGQFLKSLQLVSNNQERAKKCFYD